MNSTARGTRPTSTEGKVGNLLVPPGERMRAFFNVVLVK